MSCFHFRKVKALWITSIIHCNKTHGSVIPAIIHKKNLWLLSLQIFPWFWIQVSKCIWKGFRLIWCLDLGYECTVYPGLTVACSVFVCTVTGTVRTDKQTGGGITNNVLRSFNRPLAPSVTLRMVMETTNVWYYVHDKNVKNNLLNIIIIWLQQLHPRMRTILSTNVHSIKS